MSEQYSIAEARQDLAALVRKLEKQPSIEITRRGKTVAVLLSLQEYKRLKANREGFFTAYTKFRKEVDLTRLDIDPAIFSSVRSKEPGRDIDLDSHLLVTT
jgi:prevent-host-death family protein